MNRQDRRRAARIAGKDFAAGQQAKRDADRLEAKALNLTPERARELLGRWAAQPGHSADEVDRLNGVGK